VERIGDKRWWPRHELVEKLNMQAILNVTLNNDEFVKDLLISHNKIQTLVAELIVSETWTEKIFPIIRTSIDEKNTSTLPIYMALFHEASVVSLLETALFYKEFCEAAGDSVIDLVDYVSRKVLRLIYNDDNDADEEGELEDRQKTSDLSKQQKTIEFTICMKSLSVLRYICDAMEHIPLSALTRMLDTHDFACLLAQVLDKQPWKRTDVNGNKQIFDNNKWIPVQHHDEQLIVKLEGQVWLTLYQLLLHPEAQRKYNYTTQRRTQLLKVRRHFNELFLDQLPHLRDLQVFLEHMAVSETPTTTNATLVIEQIPEVREKLLHKYKGKWETIALRQLKENFALSSEEMKERADQLAATYNFTALESLLDEPPQCANCQGEAMKRCSRCQNEWYCSRPCQVKHWSKHKLMCNMLQESK